MSEGVDITRTRTIGAKPQAVWDVLADFGAISAWADNVDHSCILEPSPDGRPVGLSRRVQTGRMTLIERITDFEAPATIAYDIEGLPQRVRTVTNCWSLEPEGDGSTVVSLTSTVDLGSRPPQQLAARVLARVLAKQSDVMLAGLADHLETHRG